MAHEIKLEVYTIRVRKTRDTSNYISLNSLLGKDDFLLFFQQYISSFDKQLKIDDEKKKCLKIDSENLVVASNTRMISGILESGDYGIESKIYDIESGEQSYHKKVGDSDIKPFYFLLHLPKDDNKGFLILQRLGIYGIHSIFKSHFTTFFKNTYPDLQLDFNPFVSKGLANSFVGDGSIKEFIFTRYDLPSDITDRLGLSGHSEKIMSIEIKITAKKKSYLPIKDKVKTFIQDPNAKIFELKELASFGFDGNHTSKIKVKLGKSIRTVDLSDTLQIRPYYDINDEVTKDASGHPTFESIDTIAKKFINDLKTDLE